MEIALVLLILAGAVALFVTEKYPVDFVAVMVLGAVLVLGLFWESVITPQEAISGFSNPATITVGAMFVLSAALQKTGALTAVGQLVTWLGRFPWLLMAVMMVTAGVASAFINNTPVVAVMLPLILGVCTRRKISPSKLLIPLSYASQFGGVCTLIGTSTNLLVSAISERAGYGAFSMFEFSPLGIILSGVGIVYCLAVAYWLLPARRGEQLTEAYQLDNYITELRVMPKSPLIQRTLEEAGFEKKYGVRVLEILRDQQKLWSPQSEPIREGDILLVRGRMQEFMQFRTASNLQIEPEFRLRDETLEAEDLMLVETLVAPRSQLIGKTLADLNFIQRYRLVVLAIQRQDQTVREKLNAVPLAFGDAMVLLGPKQEIEKLRADENFIVLEQVEEPSLRRHKVPVALAVIAMVVTLASVPLFGEDPLPIVVTAIIGCAAVVILRCITLEEAYRAIDWRVIFLLAGVLPLGIAMEKSGAAALLAAVGLKLVGPFGPVAALAMIYGLTAVLTECMSNNAAAVLLAPIAISSALTLGVNPKPFLMAVTFAASTSFATPVGYQTNMMVYNPGGYRFSDYFKAGVPLNVIFFALAVYYIPRFWPLDAVTVP